MAHFEQWAGFKGKEWVNSVDVRSFIQENYTPYEGDESFLEGPTEATDTLWGKLQELQKEERAKGGVLDMETEVVSGLTYFCIKKKNLHIIQILHSFAFYSADAFSTCAIAAFCIGIRQFLLLPNSTITSSSLMSISTP